MIALKKFIVISLIAFQIISAKTVEEEKLSVSECKEAGFNVGTLKVSACKLLPKFQLDELYTDCLRCSSPENVKSHEKYPFAEMEVCECNLYRFPQVSAFVKSNMKDQWGNQLKVRHVRGAMPTIVLKSEDGQVQKTLNIEKWDTNTITEFLNDWLESGDDM